MTHEHNAKFTVAAHHPFRHAVGYYAPPVTSLIAISPFFRSLCFLFFLIRARTSPGCLSSIVFCSVFSCHPVIMWARWTKQGKEPRWRRKKSFCIFKSDRRARARSGELENGGSRGGSREREGERGWSYPRGEREKERKRDRGKGACATTMDRVCTPENWPAQKNRRLSRHEMIKKKEKKKRERKKKTLLDVKRKGERLIEGHALNVFNLVTLVRVFERVSRIRTRQLGHEL